MQTAYRSAADRRNKAQTRGHLKPRGTLAGVLNVVELRKQVVNLGVSCVSRARYPPSSDYWRSHLSVFCRWFCSQELAASKLENQLRRLLIFTACPVFRSFL